MFQNILKSYRLPLNEYSVIPFGTGLINNTWKVSSNNSDSNYLLQRVNTSVFKEPENIAFNIRAIADFLHTQHPGYLFISPFKTSAGEEFAYDPENGYYR